MSGNNAAGIKPDSSAPPASTSSSPTSSANAAKPSTRAGIKQESSNNQGTLNPSSQQPPSYARAYRSRKTVSLTGRARSRSRACSRICSRSRSTRPEVRKNLLRFLSSFGSMENMSFLLYFCLASHELW